MHLATTAIELIVGHDESRASETMLIGNNTCSKTVWCFPDAAFGEEQTEIVVTEVEGYLHVNFHVLPDSVIGDCYDPNDYYDEGGWVINAVVLDEAQRVLPYFFQMLTEYMIQRKQVGVTYNGTVYSGCGLGGCLATLAAVNSPPHCLYTFGMPSFCNRAVSEAIEDKVQDKYWRLAERNTNIAEMAEQGEISLEEADARTTVSQEFTWVAFESVDDVATQARLFGPYEEVGDVVWFNYRTDAEVSGSRLWRYIREKIFSPTHTSDPYVYQALLTNWQ